MQSTALNCLIGFLFRNLLNGEQSTSLDSFIADKNTVIFIAHKISKFWQYMGVSGCIVLEWIIVNVKERGKGSSYWVEQLYTRTEPHIHSPTSNEQRTRETDKSAYRYYKLKYEKKMSIYREPSVFLTRIMDTKLYVNSNKVAAAAATANRIVYGGESGDINVNSFTSIMNNNNISDKRMKLLSEPNLPNTHTKITPLIEIKI